VKLLSSVICNISDGLCVLLFFWFYVVPVVVPHLAKVAQCTLHICRE